MVHGKLPRQPRYEIAGDVADLAGLAVEPGRAAPEPPQPLREIVINCSAVAFASGAFEKRKVSQDLSLTIEQNGCRSEGRHCNGRDGQSPALEGKPDRLIHQAGQTRRRHRSRRTVEPCLRQQLAARRNHGSPRTRQSHIDSQKARCHLSSAFSVVRNR